MKKYVHKTSTAADFKEDLHKPITKCGIMVSLDPSGEFYHWKWQWRHVTCPKCLKTKGLKSVARSAQIQGRENNES